MLQQTPVKTYEGGSYIIPTHLIMNEFITNLSSLTFANYDLRELCDLSVECIRSKLAHAENLTFYSNRICENFCYRNQLLGLEADVIKDANQLGKSWVLFTLQLIELFTIYNLWNEQNVHDFRFTGFIDKFDIVITRIPMEAMPLTYDNIIIADQNRKAALYGHSIVV